MLYPLIPLFLTQTLHAPVSSVGLIEGAAEAVASLLRGLSGRFSDRLGRRKPLVLAGYGVSAVAKPLMALAAAWPWVLATRVLDRFGKGLRSPARDALIADSSEPRYRGRAFGFHRSADQTGAVIGPLLALPLLAWFDSDYRALFAWAFFPAALGVLLLALVREPGRETAAEGPAGPLARPLRPAGAAPEASPSGAPGALTLSGPFRRYLLVMAVFALGNSSNAFLILRAQELGASASTVALLFAVFNLATVFSAWPAGWISDHTGRRAPLAFSFLVFGVAYTGFALAGSGWWMWPLFAVYGLYSGMGEGLAKAMAVDLVPPQARGTALGMLSMAMGLVTLPASAAAGWLWDAYGSWAAFSPGAALSLLAAALLLLFVPAPGPAHPNPHQGAS